MADLFDVENAFTNTILNAVYPGGPGTPSTFGAECRIYRGWPVATALDADLAAGRINITVLPDNTGEHPGDYLPTWHPVTNVPTLAATTNGNSVTFAGQANAGQLVGLLVSGVVAVYRTSDGDTSSSVAANLAATIRQHQIVQLSGTSLTVPDASAIVARIVMDANDLRPVRRQSHDIRIAHWCPSADLRDAAASKVDAALARVQFLELPDTSDAHVKYKTTVIHDRSQSANLYRRDLIYTATYAITETVSLPAMLFGELNQNALTIYS